jgi:hypothetical protein
MHHTNRCLNDDVEVMKCACQLLGRLFIKVAIESFQ